MHAVGDGGVVLGGACDVGGGREARDGEVSAAGMQAE
jgi:hypothetical protein